MNTDTEPLAALKRVPITLCLRKPSILLEAHLRDHGFKFDSCQDGPIALHPEGVIWIRNTFNRFPKLLRQLKACPADARPMIAMWFPEPLPPPRAANLPRPRLHLKEIAKILLRDRRITDVYSNAAGLKSMKRNGILDVLVVSTAARKEYLEENGIKAFHIPFGYKSKSHGEYLGLERTRDVIFLGAMVPRRKKLIEKLKKSGIQVDSMGSWTDPAMWGKNRTRMLNSTRIFLNLGRQPGEAPGTRLILGMACKCLVISEPAYKPEPYVPGKHFVTCSNEEMPDVIRYYLAHPEERHAIADAGYRFVTETMTWENANNRFLALLDEKVRERNRS